MFLINDHVVIISVDILGSLIIRTMFSIHLQISQPKFLFLFFIISANNSYTHGRSVCIILCVCVCIYIFLLRCVSHFFIFPLFLDVSVFHCPRGVRSYSVLISIFSCVRSLNKKMITLAIG